MQTVGMLIKVLETLSGDMPIQFSIWVRHPGARIPPRKIGADGQPIDPARPEPKLKAQDLALIRMMACDGQQLTIIGKRLGVHRSTVSRYIQAELRAGRMGRTGKGQYAIARGAYDLETGAPVNPPVDKA